MVHCGHNRAMLSKHYFNWSNTLYQGWPFEMRGSVVLCKPYSVLLCVLEQPRVDNSSDGSNWFNSLKGGPALYSNKRNDVVKCLSVFDLWYNIVFDSSDLRQPLFVIGNLIKFCFFQILIFSCRIVLPNTTKLGCHRYYIGWLYLDLIDWYLMPTWTGFRFEQIKLIPRYVQVQ